MSQPLYEVPKEILAQIAGQVDHKLEERLDSQRAGLGKVVRGEVDDLVLVKHEQRDIPRQIPDLGFGEVGWGGGIQSHRHKKCTVSTVTAQSQHSHSTVTAQSQHNHSHSIEVPGEQTWAHPHHSTAQPPSQVQHGHSTVTAQEKQSQHTYQITIVDAIMNSIEACTKAAIQNSENSM